MLVLLALVIGRVLWFLHDYGRWNPFDYPDRLTVDGRTYYPSIGTAAGTVPPGAIVTRKRVGEIATGELWRVGSVGLILFSSVGGHDIYGVGTSPTDSCMTAALVKLGADKYDLYELSGGC